MAPDAVSSLPPTLRLLHHEQTDDSLHELIGAIPMSLLDPSTLKSVPSQSPVLAPSQPESEVTTWMASSASSAQSVSFTPAPPVESPPVESPPVEPTHDIDVFVKRGQDGRVNSGTLPGLIQELIVNSGGLFFTMLV